MKNPNQKAKRDLPSLRLSLNALLKIADEIIKEVQYSEDDHLGFMALCFLSKQIDHSRSILRLIPSRDVVLVARSMIEGLCQLLWAAKEPKVLPLRWRAFAWVHDWRVLHTQISAGVPIDPTRSRTIDDALRQHGDQFLKPRARKARESGSSLPDDPYYENWRTVHSIRQICECVGGGDLYLKLYKPFSDWHHWGAGGLGDALVRQQNRVVYSSLSAIDSAAALATGFQCLLQTVQHTDTHLDIGMTPMITEIRDEFLRLHGEPSN